MKIGLIGNMNNNNFAMMRYFRDLGADAHLLLNSNDGIGPLSHFKPECDTWNIDCWKSYIHQTKIPNSPIAALDYPYSYILSIRSFIHYCFGKINNPTTSVSKRSILKAYNGFDRLVASGIAPATLRRAGIKLDLFYPYSNGVEYFRSPWFINQIESTSQLGKLLFQRIAEKQKEGIVSANVVFNTEISTTRDILNEIGVTQINMAIPMVYDKEIMPDDPPSKICKLAWSSIINSELTLLHHARLMWSKPSKCLENDWVKESKNNDWLLYGFADLVKKRPNLKACLILIEYGPDVNVTKQLVNDLGINNYILWLPIMERRELTWILSRVSIGVGEFYDLPRIIWGGTGWETIAAGKPLLQSFNFSEIEFEQLFGYPPPPMLQVKSKEDILLNLIEMVDNPQKCIEIGHRAKYWFRLNSGEGLAKKWLEVIRNARCDPFREVP